MSPNRPSNFWTYVGVLFVITCVVPFMTFMLRLSACGVGLPSDVKDGARRVVCHKVLSAIGQLINFCACVYGWYYMYQVWKGPKNITLNINK